MSLLLLFARSGPPSPPHVLADAAHTWTPPRPARTYRPDPTARAWTPPRRARTYRARRR